MDGTATELVSSGDEDKMLALYPPGRAGALRTWSIYVRVLRNRWSSSFQLSSISSQTSCRQGEEPGEAKKNASVHRRYRGPRRGVEM
jgi:hypothetical protein